MTSFFATMWLKNEDSESDVKLISKTIKQIARDMKINIEDEIDVSSGGNRITIRGVVESKNPDAQLKAFAESLTEETERKTKGRLLK